jgi:nitroreductase
MELFTAIQTRHSLPRVRQDPVPRETIERLLSAAVQAPNHHHNRPWRFVVISGKARERMGEVLANALKFRMPDASEPALEAERKRPLRAPLLIVVGVDRPIDPKVSETEDICASAAAVENLLLAAHDCGLGAIWRTGAAASDPTVKEFLGFSPAQLIIAIVYIGFPEPGQTPYQRPSFEDRVTWMEA